MIRNFLAFFLVFFLVCRQAFSCPCGCGSDDFLYLEASEKFKYRLSYSHEFSPIYYDRDTDPHTDDSKIRKTDTYEIASVFSPFDNISLSFQMPFKRNAGEKESYYSFADPSVHILSSLFETDFYDSFHLSIRSGLSLKFPIARSFSETNELSIFSNGHWELSPNLGASIKHENWTFLAKETLTIRIPKEGPVIHPIINRFNLGVAYTLFGLGQFMVNLNQELRFEPSTEAVLGRYTHSLKWSLGTRIGDRKNLTLSYKHPVIAQKNAPFYKEFNLSFSHAL